MCGGPLIVTNNLYAPTPNGQSPSASLNKSNTPTDEIRLRLSNKPSTLEPVSRLLGHISA